MRAGNTAASTPAAIAAKTSNAIVAHGIASTTPSSDSAWVVRTARKPPTAIPSAPPISARDDAFVADHVAAAAGESCPTARSIPISRVRSNTESTRVFTTPNRLMITERPSRA